VRAVIAKSFERIHRSNLVMMGVLPCQFKEGTDEATLELDGTETFDLSGMENGPVPRQDALLSIPPGERSDAGSAGDAADRYPIEVELLPARRHPSLRLRQILGCLMPLPKDA